MSPTPNVSAAWNVICAKNFTMPEFVMRYRPSRTCGSDRIGCVFPVNPAQMSRGT